MKKYILSILFILSLMININIYADESELSQDLAVEILNGIQIDINNGNVDNIIENLSPNAKSELKEAILTNIKGKKIEFVQELKNIENLGEGKYKISAVYVAKGINWNASGLSNFYIVEYIEGRWYILDTDFYQFMPQIFSMLGGIFPILMLLGFFFFIWMLSDCSKRIIENKWIWILLIIFVPFGSVIYFFTGRKKFPLQDEQLKKVVII